MQSSLISQKHALLQELAPCVRRLPGFIGLVPPPALDKSVAYSIVHSKSTVKPRGFHPYEDTLPDKGTLVKVPQALDRIISNLCETVDKVYTFFDSLRVIIDDFQEVAYLDGDRPKPNRICSSSVGVRQSTRRRAT